MTRAARQKAAPGLQSALSGEASGEGNEPGTGAAAVILREQTERYRAGRCLFCGIALPECWCGAQDPEVYEPVDDDSVEVGVE